MNEHPIDPFLAAWSDASGTDGFASRPLASRALQLPGPWTRARLHAALAEILVQEPEQRDQFEETFALWFGTDVGDQEGEILDLDAWLRTPLAPVGQAGDAGEDRVADAECLVGLQQPTAIMSPHQRRRGHWSWAALDATVLLIVVACALGVGRKPSPKPGAASPRLSRKTVPDTSSVVEGHSQPTEVRRSHAKLRLAATDGEKEREQRDQGDLLTPSRSSMRQRTLTEEHSRDQRATAGSPPDAELSAAQGGQRVAVAGPAEPPTAPDGPMSRAQAIEALGKAGIVKKEHRSGLGGLKWFYSKGSVEPEAIPALDSLGGSIGLLFSEESAPKLSPLRSLQRLKGLDLGWTKLSDVSALEGISLTHLELSGTKVSDVSALKRMPLTHLDLAWTQVSDLSALAGMRLTYLELGGTKVSDLSALKGTPLTSLSLFRTQTSDLSPLKGMPLTHLDLGRTKVSDVSALKGMSLTKLDLKGTPVSDVSALKGMPLQWLDLGGTKVDDAAALKGMSLTRLDLSGTPVSDLSALKGMPLQWLDLSGTPVSDLSALKGMPIQWLDLSGTKVTDVSALESLRLLQTLYVRGLVSPVKDWSPVPSGVKIIPSPPTRQTASSRTAP
jgi:Leucine-rich repeat (LRR) protein